MLLRHITSPLPGCLACVRSIECWPALDLLLASEHRWRTTRCCQREACWWQFPEEGRGFQCWSQPTPCCEEAQQRMSALDFWRTSLNATTSDLSADTAKTQPLAQLLTSLLLANPTAASMSVQSGQFGLPSFYFLSPRQHVHIKICTFSLTLPLLYPSLMTLSTPSHKVPCCLWVMESAVVPRCACGRRKAFEMCLWWFHGCASYGWWIWLKVLIETILGPGIHTTRAGVTVSVSVTL